MVDKMQVVRVIVFFAVVACARATLLNLSCDDIREFVNGHNWRRQQVTRGEIAGQPAAATMKYLIWDNEIAGKAANWASENRNIHNPSNEIGSRRFTTGENLYWYSTTDFGYRLPISQALRAWFDEEHNLYSFGPHGYHMSNVGHYTQMVWADTTHIGCAIAQFHESGWNKFFVVCNYGPAGNVIGREPYSSSHGDGGRRLICPDEGCDRPYGDQC